MNTETLTTRLVSGENRPPGLVVALTVTAAIALVIATAWISRPLFFGAAALLAVLAAYAALRWPRVALVGAVLVTLGDPYVYRLLLPAELEFALRGVSEGLLIAVGLVIVVQALRRGTLLDAFRDPVTVLAVLFVLVGMVSTVVNGVPPFVAALGIIVTLDALAVYYLVRMLRFDLGAATLAIGALVAVTTAACLVGIAQAFLAPDVLGFRAFEGRFGEGPRVSGFLGNPNLLAALIGLTLPFPLFATRSLPVRRERIAAMAILFIMALALILTFSRGAWAGVALGLFIGTLLIDRRALVLVGAVVLAAYLVASVTPRTILVDPSQRPQYGDGSGEAPPDIFDSVGDRFGAISSNSDLRLRFIAEGVPILLDHPVLGVGPGRYGGAVAKIVESPVYEEYDTGLYGFRTVHNFWLHVFGEFGIVGGVIFLAMVVGLILRFVRAARRSTGLHRALLGGAATAIIVVTMHNLTEMLFEGNFPAFAIWMVVGLASLLAPVRPLFPEASAPGTPA